MKRTDTKPWHRQPLVWMIIAIPFSAVVMGAWLLYFSIDSYDGLVVDDYYKHGKEINLVLARDRKAAELGLRGQVSIEVQSNRVRVSIGSGEGSDIPSTMELKLLHATRAGFDKTVALSPQGPGIFAGDLSSPLARGSWNVQLGNAEWRIVGRLRIPDSPHAQLKPGV